MNETEEMVSLDCGCRGECLPAAVIERNRQNDMLDPCAMKATEEDGYCDRCRGRLAAKSLDSLQRKVT